MNALLRKGGMPLVAALVGALALVDTTALVGTTALVACTRGDDVLTRDSPPRDGCSMCGTSCVDLASDPHHCGACSHDCLGGGCEAQVCQPFVVSAGNGGSVAGALSGDSQFIDWVDYAKGNLMRQPLSVGDPRILVPAVGRPFLFTAAFEEVFWTVALDSGGGVFRWDGAAHSLASGPGYYEGIEVDQDFVYWAVASDADAGVWRASRATEERTRLTSTQANTLALTASAIYATAGALEGVIRIDKGTLQTSVLTTGQKGPWGLVVREPLVYFTTYDGGQLVRLREDGTDLQVLASGLVSPQALALDDTYAYLVEREGGRVDRVPLAGGPVTQLAVHQKRPTGLRLTHNALYFTTDDGNVLRLAK